LRKRELYEVGSIIANSSTDQQAHALGGSRELLGYGISQFGDTVRGSRLKSSAGKATAEWQCTKRPSSGSIRKASPLACLRKNARAALAFGKSTMDEAAVRGPSRWKPNPSTLAFITKRLYEEKPGRRSEGISRRCKVRVLSPQNNVSHLIFALAGNAEGCPALHSIGRPCFRLNFGLQKQSGILDLPGVRGS